MTGRRAYQYMIDSETTGCMNPALLSKSTEEKKGKETDYRILGCKGAYIPVDDPQKASLIVFGSPFFRDYLVGFHLGTRADRSDRYIEFAPSKDLIERQRDRSPEIEGSYAAACYAAASSQNQYQNYPWGSGMGQKRKSIG